MRWQNAPAKRRKVQWYPPVQRDPERIRHLVSWFATGLGPVVLPSEAGTAADVDEFKRLNEMDRFEFVLLFLVRCEVRRDVVLGEHTPGAAAVDDAAPDLSRLPKTSIGRVALEAEIERDRRSEDGQSAGGQRQEVPAEPVVHGENSACHDRRQRDESPRPEECHSNRILASGVHAPDGAMKTWITATRLRTGRRLTACPLMVTYVKTVKESVSGTENPHDMVAPMSRFIACFLFVLAAPGLASADVRFDETYTTIKLNHDINSGSGNQPSTVTYKVQMNLRFYGDVHEGDAVRVIWKQGRRELANIRCPIDYYGGNDHVEPNASTSQTDHCWDDGPNLDVHGDVSVEVHYIDDQTETTELLRTMSFEIGRVWRVDRIIRNRPVHSPRYLVLGDDLLGLSWAWLKTPQRTEPFGDVRFLFWAAREEDHYPDPSFRCNRDGERVSEMDESGNGLHQSINDWGEQDDSVRRGTRTTSRHIWRLFLITPELIWGERNPTASSNASNPRTNLTAAPGVYECRFRSAGETVRSFRFTVANGTITPHAAQSGADGLSLRPGGVFIETRFGDGAPDRTLQPARIRRGTAFGHAWNDPASVQEMLGALPAARGSSEPGRPDGVRR